MDLIYYNAVFISPVGE